MLSFLVALLVIYRFAAAGPCADPSQINTPTLGCISGSVANGLPRGVRVLLRAGAVAPFSFTRTAPPQRTDAEMAAVGAPFPGAPGPAEAAFAQLDGSGAWSRDAALLLVTPSASLSAWSAGAPLMNGEALQWSGGASAPFVLAVGQNGSVVQPSRTRSATPSGSPSTRRTPTGRVESMRITGPSRR